MSKIVDALGSVRHLGLDTSLFIYFVDWYKNRPACAIGYTCAEVVRWRHESSAML
jgi:hypothetical protein